MDSVATEVRVGVAHPVMEVQRTFSFSVISLVHGTNHREVGRGGGLIGGLKGEVVCTEHDVLRRRENRLTARGREDVIRRHHQELALHDGFQGKRDVDGHLVTVEVRVVSGTDERVQTDSVTFDEDRLESLNRETVERRGAVQEDWVAAGDFFQDVPNFGLLLLDVLTGAAHGVGEAEVLQAADDKRLKENEGHLLRETALVELKLWTDDDDRTTGVVDALTE